MNIRPGKEGDAAAAAGLHAKEIGEGFLSSLGVPFLTLLYRRVARWPRSFLLVADADGDVIGMVAVAENTGALYKAFLVHDGVRASLRNAPRLLRSIRRILETLRYPGGDDDDLPDAEILSVAVSPAAKDHGVGRALLEAAVVELARRGVRGAKVVTTVDNVAARRLYEAAGFSVAKEISVHTGTPSVVYVRR